MQTHDDIDETAMPEAEAFKLYGVTMQEMENPLPALFSGGIDKMYRVRKAMNYRESLSARMARDRAMDRAKEDEETQHKAKQNYQEFLETRPPLWQLVTRMLPESEPAYSPQDRYELLGNFICALQNVIRYELHAPENSESAPIRALRSKLAPQVSNHVPWDPLPQL